MKRSKFAYSEQSIQKINIISNDENLSLTNILEKNGFLWPSPIEYEKCSDRYVKKKIYVYTKKKTKKLSTSLKLEDLMGIWGREMPAMT
jgi:hypothetical protein